MINDPPVQPGIAFPISPTSAGILGNNFENNFINTLWQNIVYYKTTFEAIAPSMITCNAGSGASCPSTGVSGLLTLNTETATSGQYADIDKTPLYASGLSWQRNARMRVGAQFGAAAAQTAYIIRGSQNIVSPYYGFKVVNATLYGVYYAGTGSEYTVNLQQIAASGVPITSANIYLLEAQYSANDAVKFLVNGTYKGMIRVNTAPIAPTASTVAFYNFRIATTANVGKELGISFFEYIQEK